MSGGGLIWVFGMYARVSRSRPRAQRRGRYLFASTAHPGKMLPELARTIIGAYSSLGELVLDPMCGIGTTLVEAIHLERGRRRARAALGGARRPKRRARARAGRARARARPARRLP